MKIDRKLRETVAGQLLQDMISMNAQRGIPNPTQENLKLPGLDGPLLAQLLEDNFKKLDLDGDGISRRELALAMVSPQSFSNDEYAMLKLVSKYFETIASMCDDQKEGESLRITRLDKDVLVQFLKHSKMSLSDIHDWLALNERSVAPPPASGAE